MSDDRDAFEYEIICAPQRSFLVPRPRLIETLNLGLAGKLSLISAAAGFGKTTLVSSWIDAQQSDSANPGPTRIAWLSLDDNDSVLTRFLSYVIAAGISYLFDAAGLLLISGKMV